jgi:hypothetical protein
VVGTAAHSNDQGVEISEVEAFKTTTALNSVRAYFDNFNNTNEPINYVIAICSAVHTVNKSLESRCPKGRDALGRPFVC